MGCSEGTQKPAQTGNIEPELKKKSGMRWGEGRVGLRRSGSLASNDKASKPNDDLVRLIDIP